MTDKPTSLTQAPEGYNDCLAHDLRTAFPNMKGFSPRSLKYMRTLADAWPNLEFVQGVLAQLSWYHQIERDLQGGSE